MCLEVDSDVELLSQFFVPVSDGHFCHFCFHRYLALSEPFFCRSVLQQMAEWHSHKGDLPDDLDKLHALYQQFIGEPLSRSQVLVLDGLDEVTRWKLAPYLSRRLPDNLHIIVTIRDVGQDWQAEYRMPANQMQELQLGGLEIGGIADVLRAAGGKAIALADDAAFVSEVRPPLMTTARSLRRVLRRCTRS